MRKLKNTVSTHPLDLPAKLRREYDIFLTQPLKDIFNTCLMEQKFPDLWKIEYVTPIPKQPRPENISHLRKIACTSDYSKLFEAFLKEWILNDIEDKLDPSQFGGRSGSGTEHLIVSYIDRILKLLDSRSAKTAVIAAAADFMTAFDRTDPTRTAAKFIKIGVRPSLIPILISYLSDRKMIVKYKGAESNPQNLVGGGPQGTLLGGLQYIVSSDDCSQEKVSESDRFKYFDDLNIVEFIILTEVLIEYPVMEHVPSDVGINQKYLPVNCFDLQNKLDDISDWKEENLMALNESKSFYIIIQGQRRNSLQD